PGFSLAAVVLRTIHVVPREREGQRFPRGALRLAGERLVDVDPALGEGVGAAGEVDAPDAKALLARDADGARAGRFQPVRPLATGARVVAAERLDVDHLEAGAGHVAQSERDVRQLAVREDIAVDERAGPTLGLAVHHVARRYAVIQHEPVVRQKRAYLR